MHDTIRSTLKTIVGAALALTLWAATATAAPGEDANLRQLVRDLDARIDRQMPDPSVSARTLIQDAGLGEVTALTGITAPLAIAPSAFQRGAPPDSKLMDLRLPLGLIAQIYGGKDNFDVVYAQPNERTRVLVIENGNVTMADVFDLLARHGIQEDRGAGRNVLRAPVILWDDATLRLSPGESLVLSRTDGAAILNFGRLELDGVKVSVEGPESPGAPDFVPFIANAGGASVLARNSHFKGLGFGNELKFSGFSVIRNPMLVRRDQVVIENNTFDDVVSLGVSMADRAIVRNNRIHNTRGASLIVTHSSETRIMGNLITGKAPTNGIRLLQGSSRSLIAGNVILEGERAGIAVRNDSNNILVRNNIVWRRGGGGISLSKVACGVVDGNLVIDNRQKGIEVRSGRQIAVRNNWIVGNNSAGVWVSAQAKDDVTLIEDNRLTGNGSGLASAKGAFLQIAGNDFTRQFPQFVAGDLAPQARLIAANIRGDTPMVLTAAGVHTGAVPAQDCTN